MSTKTPKPTAPKPDIKTNDVTSAGDPAPRKNAPVPRLKISNNNFTIDQGELGERALMTALGTDSREFMTGLLTQLANACAPGLKEKTLNFMVSGVAGIKPQDQIEAMLAAQTVAVHALPMTYARRVARAETILELDSVGRVFNKLTTTFLAQIETLKRCRSSGEPSLMVQNVSVQDGGQAIVGNVTQHASASVPKAGSPPAAITDAGVAPMSIVGERDPVLASSSGKLKT